MSHVEKTCSVNTFYLFKKGRNIRNHNDNSCLEHWKWICDFRNGHGPNTFWDAIYLFGALGFSEYRKHTDPTYNCFSFMVDHGPRFQRNPRLGRRHFEIVFTGLNLSCKAQHVKFFFHQLSLHSHHSVFPTWQILMLARLHLHSLPAFENMCSPRCVWEYIRRNYLMPIICLKRPHV